jgi:ATP-dependent Clp protease ATP-binding subunit ClpB
MQIEKFTEKLKGFLQSARSLAMRGGHQALLPVHLLKVMLEDPEGLCMALIRKAGGDG